MSTPLHNQSFLLIATEQWIETDLPAFSKIAVH